MITKTSFEEKFVKKINSYDQITTEEHSLGIKVKNGLDVYYISFEKESVNENMCFIKMYHNNVFYRPNKGKKPSDIHLQFTKWITVSNLVSYIIKHNKKYNLCLK